MRKILLTAALAVLVSAPLFAQFRGMGGDPSVNILNSPDAQKELKLTEAQKKDLKEATKTRDDAMTKAREDMDFSGIRDIMETYNKSVVKVKDSLKADQKKRLMQIELQQAEKGKQVTIFKNEEVVKALKLTEKQKDYVADYEKDVKELFEESKGFEAFQKMRTMGTETYAKITKSLSETQKSAWKELKGEEFKGEIVNPFGMGKGKGKGKKKDDL